MLSDHTYSVIIGSGSYLPTKVVGNDAFLSHTFYDSNGQKLSKTNQQIVDQLVQITGIHERRYVEDDLVASDIATLAAVEAIRTSGIDPESLDHIIVSHNFGDIRHDNRRSDLVPSLASRVKYNLGINNPETVAYDLPFGCAGWLQGVIQADQYIKSGTSKRVLIIGAETLSRICDPHDRDSMIYSDGAGAVILEAQQSDVPIGIITHVSKTYASPFAYFLRLDKSYNPTYAGDDLFLKMDGRKLYEQVLKNVPTIISECIEKANLSISAISRFLIHQANQKMDEAVIARLFEQYGIAEVPKDKMPMTISFLGNSSVATIPTLFDLIANHNLKSHTFKKGEHIVMAAMGAGININSLVYTFPTDFPISDNL
ncbi:ketoacyl-ACP synthase III [Sphingobacterium sp. SRCM116780]|uniref:3-oxoacyl-ACP synthase III family protein n=1 Tax=Sphingobacterium sp. SRCM116780 TaxID=2907623 RepID=UPI001F3A36AE|nr:ketoacyl-ACP synthase III [Sphingobacterium sp. SRCM116780]UIR54910.1 ketoacyl-ACP synthase III [Sphingobacterium sp. SRCM116780]